METKLGKGRDRRAHELLEARLRALRLQRERLQSPQDRRERWRREARRRRGHARPPSCLTILVLRCEVRKRV